MEFRPSTLVASLLQLEVSFRPLAQRFLCRTPCLHPFLGSSQQNHVLVFFNLAGDQYATLPIVSQISTLEVSVSVTAPVTLTSLPAVSPLWSFAFCPSEHCVPRGFTGRGLVLSSCADSLTASCCHAVSPLSSSL